MTPKEAIAKLERLQEPEPWEPQIDSEMFEALEMGIEALKKQVGTDINVGTTNMTTKEAIKKLKAKAECMKREISGTDIDCNLRRCDDCELCYAQGTCGEQIQAIEALINATSGTSRHKCREQMIGDQNDHRRNHSNPQNRTS